MKSFLITALIVGMLGLPGTATATDQNRPVLDVLIADVNGDLDGFLDRMQRIEGVAKRLGLPAKLRVFQATFAAEKNGEIHLYWELPSFIEFARAETALHNDPEFLAILGEMDAAGQRFKSELLSIEITKQ
ncbi:MAG: hypothetical protein R3192_08250 [Woeseiaceae bacterium]|nr:hypothetical protein [Woeseiaceae bacterium]